MTLQTNNIQIKEEDGITIITEPAGSGKKLLIKNEWLTNRTQEPEAPILIFSVSKDFNSLKLKNIRQEFLPKHTWNSLIDTFKNNPKTSLLIIDDLMYPESVLTKQQRLRQLAELSNKLNCEIVVTTEN